MGLLTKLLVCATALLSFASASANPVLSRVSIVQDKSMIKHNHFFAPQSRKLLAFTVSNKKKASTLKLGKTFILTKKASNIRKAQPQLGQTSKAQVSKNHLRKRKNDAGKAHKNHVQKAHKNHVGKRKNHVGKRKNHVGKRKNHVGKRKNLSLIHI